MKNALFFSALLMFTVLTFQACSKKHEGQPPPNNNVENNALFESVKPIFESKCASCHANGAALGGFGSVLDPEKMEEEGFVLPAVPNGSSVFIEVNSGNMPPSGSLTQSEIDAIEEWIQFGFEVEDPPTAVFFETDIKPIIDAQCISCHNPTSGNDAADWPLTTYVEVMLVVWPGDPEQSLLFDSITRPVRTMPKDLPALPQTSIDAIELWIQTGAVETKP